MTDYAIWDSRSGNMIGSFDEERDALALVGRAVRERGEGENLFLVVDGANIIDGEELRARALGQIDGCGPVSREAVLQHLREQHQRAFADLMLHGRYYMERITHPGSAEIEVRVVRVADVERNDVT